MSSISPAAALCVVLGISSVVGAEEGSQRLTDFSDKEFRSLPRVCLAQPFINNDLDAPLVPERERERWAATLGPSYIHYHHYCWALLYQQRAMMNPKQRGFLYQQAIDNYDYVIRNSEQTFALLPEVFFRKGNTLLLMGKQAEAASSYLQAIQLKDDYSPAYAALIQLHMDLGDLGAAERVLETGLKFAPNSKILARRKEELSKR